MDERTRIFVDNFTRYLKRSGKTQTEIAEEIKVPKSTVNTWIKGKALPRMGKIEALADIFKCSITDLLEEPRDISFANPYVIAQITKDKELYNLIELYLSLSDRDRELINSMIIKCADK